MKLAHGRRVKPPPLQINTSLDVQALKNVFRDTLDALEHAFRGTFEGKYARCRFCDFQLATTVQTTSGFCTDACLRAWSTNTMRPL